MGMNYTKQPLDYADIISMLKSRGLVISDENNALECLKRVSYFRLANYFHPMEKDKVNHIFKPNSKFDNAIDLYNFDRYLRLLLFSAVQSLEIGLRTKMIHHISLRYGAFWFTDASHFQNQDIFQNCLKQVMQELSRTKEDFIVDHFAKYDTPDVPPVWKTLEVTSFGTLSRLFCNLSDNALKKAIAREFCLPQHKIFESWIKSAVALRNCLAHHSRVWNRVYPIKPQIPTKLKGKWISIAVPQANKLYPQLCYLQYIQNIMCPGNDFGSQLKILLKQHPNIDVAAMGFPASWQNEPLWKQL